MVGNSVSVCTTAFTITDSAAASGRLSTSWDKSMRATPSLITSRSMDTFSGNTVRKPSRAASISLYGLCTIRESVALAMPSVSGIERITGTR